MTYSLVRSPSTFPPSLRPIYPYPIANVTHKNKEVAYPQITKALEIIAGRHLGDRILAHTVSYDLTRYIRTASTSLKDRFVYYETSTDRQRAIKEYLAKPGAILLASSLDRGIDLPGDDCRAIVVCKIPYPNLGDKQVNARIHLPGGQLWYNVQTVRKLVQMTGRGMRSVDDYCESYILDQQFVSNVWKKNKSLLPMWWKEAVVTNVGRLV